MKAIDFINSRKKFQEKIQLSKHESNLLRSNKDEKTDKVNRVSFHKQSNV